MLSGHKITYGFRNRCCRIISGISSHVSIFVTYPGFHATGVAALHLVPICASSRRLSPLPSLNFTRRDFISARYRVLRLSLLTYHSRPLILFLFLFSAHISFSKQQPHIFIILYLSITYIPKRIYSITIHLEIRGRFNRSISIHRAFMDFTNAGRPVHSTQHEVYSYFLTPV